MDTEKNYERCLARAAYCTQAGWVVERDDVPEEGRVVWTATTATLHQSWQYLRFGQRLSAEFTFHPNFADFWLHFERADPNLVEPYSKLHPEHVGYVDYITYASGTCRVHLIEKTVPTPSQVHRMLEAWRSLARPEDARRSR